MGDWGVADQQPAGAGRPANEAGGPEPGRSYFTALGAWPTFAGMSRTTLADRLGCSASTLSALLNNKGPHADTRTALDWAMRIIDACGGAKRDLAYWVTFHSQLFEYTAGARAQLPTPPQPGAPPALRRWPELAGMTHGALAEGLGLSPSYVDELPPPPEPGEKRFDPSEPPADEVKLRRLSERVDAELIRDLYKALTELHHMKWRPQASTDDSGSTAWLEWLDDRESTSNASRFLSTNSLPIKKPIF
jgi:transcriptional regulator with XRE-family HTH domain